MRIQHNIMAMSAYRNYTNNVSAMQKNLEKLSSGYKINRAGDDAAGLAISEKMRAQITGLETAQKNAKDGISLVKTAEGALTEVHDMLNRMVELATQSANGTYDNDVDRAQMQKELNQLRSEVDRIADSSNFNGIKLLDGSLDSSVKTTNEEDITQITGAFTVIHDGQLGKEEQAGVFELDLSGFEGKVKDGAADTTVTIFGVTTTIAANTFATDDPITGDQLAEAIAKQFTGADADHGAFDDYGVKLKATAKDGVVTFTMDKAPKKAWNKPSGTDELTMKNITKSTAGGNGNQEHGLQVKTLVEPVDSKSSRYYAQAKFDVSKLKIKDGSTLTIGDSTYVFAVGKDSKYKDSENIIDLTDLSKDFDIAKEKGRIAARITTAAKDNKNFKVASDSAVQTDGSGDGIVYLTEKEGGVDTKNYKLEGTSNADDEDDGDWTGLLKFGTADSKKMGSALTLQIGDTADSFNQLKVSVNDMHCKAMGIDGISIADQDSAATAVDSIKAAINYVSDVRGTLGATQNRLDHTMNNLSVMTENIQDAESTIRDVDIADEMMAYTKNNILIQSAQAMLAQANQVPQGVLQLLG